MKLQILVPQYKETEEVIKPLLDSIAIQQNVDLANEVGVIIVNDGSDVVLSESFLSGYPFKVQYILAPHGGVSAARNAALDAAEAEYVMWCDADDMFYNACGLWIIFREIENGGFDGLVSVFIEETRDPATKDVLYINRENDQTFVHGKVWRRQYLLDNKIRWNPNLTIHEDSYFNILARSLSQNIKYCISSFYLWKWRDESVCRHDPKYMLKTYQNFIDSNDALVGEFLNRGNEASARECCTFLLFDAYYTMNKPEWLNQENVEYRDATERRLAQYYQDRKSLWDSTDKMAKMLISNGVRGRLVGEGMEMERLTINDWLNYVEGLL